MPTTQIALTEGLKTRAVHMLGGNSLETNTHVTEPVISISALVRSQQIISAIITLLFYLLPFSSSIFYPIESVPYPVSIVAPWNPVTLVSESVRTGFYSLSIETASVNQIVFLAIWAGAFLLIAVRVLHRARI